MYLVDWINYVKENDGRCQEVTIEGNDETLYEFYIFDKDAYDKREKHPRKYKDLYVSYLRLSEHGGMIYTRHDGWTQYGNDEYIKDIIDRLCGIKD